MIGLTSSSRSRLPALAMAAWATWLGWLGMMAAMLAAGPWHPHFLPATTAFGLFLAASLAVVGGGVWRLVRGPGRLHAATWLLLGVAPALFVAGHVLYGLRLNTSRVHQLDLPIKLLAPFGLSIMDLEARFLYPERTEGEAVVMIAPPSPTARQQVAAMDAHVRALLARLGGRAIAGKIHWARGPLLGADGRAALGLCMGSQVGEVGATGDPLAYLDRHEVAHSVICGLVRHLEIDPPTLLVEGWAEANAGRPREEVRRQVWDMRQNGEERPLRTLFGPDWYHAHVGAVYPQGAILVDHILDAYGADRFLELYRTGRPETFEADCRRVLGVGLGDLDAACRAEVDRAAPPESSLAAALAAIEVGPGVDAEGWGSFVRDFVAGVERSDRAYEQARVVVEMTWTAKHPTEGPAKGAVRWTWSRSGPRRAVVYEAWGVKEGDAWSAAPGPLDCSVWSAAPEQSFRAARRAPGESWKLVLGRDETPEADHLRMGVQVDNRRPPVLTPKPGVFGLIERPEGSPRFALVSLGTFQEPAGRRVRLRFEAGRPGSVPGLRSSECVFDADRGMALLSEVHAYDEGGETRTEYRYEAGDPPPVRSARLTGTGPGQNERVVDWTVLERRLGPISEEDFTPMAMLDGPVAVVPSGDGPWTDPPTFADRYPVPLAAGAAMIVVGLALGLVGGFRRPPVS